MSAPVIRFLVDENVPDDVVVFLTARGHEALRVREHMLAGTPDPAVAAAGDDLEAVLLTGDSDFKKIATRIPDGQKTRFRRLSRISLACKQPRSKELLERWILHIELEYTQAQSRKDKRIFIVVQDGGIKLNG